MEDRYPDRHVLAIASSFDTSVNKLIRALILSFNSLSLSLSLPLLPPFPRNYRRRRALYITFCIIIITKKRVCVVKSEVL